MAWTWNDCYRLATTPNLPDLFCSYQQPASLHPSTILGRSEAYQKDEESFLFVFVASTTISQGSIYANSSKDHVS